MGNIENRSIKICFHVNYFTGNDYLLRSPVVPLVDEITSRERGGRRCLRRGVKNEKNKPWARILFEISQLWVFSHFCDVICFVVIFCKIALEWPERRGDTCWVWSDGNNYCKSLDRERSSFRNACFWRIKWRISRKEVLFARRTVARPFEMSRRSCSLWLLCLNIKRISHQFQIPNILLILEQICSVHYNINLK